MLARSTLKNGFMLFWFFLFLTSICSASTPQAIEVEKTYANWCAAIGSAKGNAHEVVKYYAAGAILLPTLSPKILMNYHGGLNDYFVNLTQYPNIKCTTDKLITRVYGKSGRFAINTGLYTFSYTDTDGKTKEIPARFSFVYQKFNHKWLIINHNSSVLP